MYGKNIKKKKYLPEFEYLIYCIKILIHFLSIFTHAIAFLIMRSCKSATSAKGIFVSSLIKIWVKWKYVNFLLVVGLMLWLAVMRSPHMRCVSRAVRCPRYSPY